MIEITGKFNKAVCYTDEIEPGAAEQIKAVCDMPAYEGQKIAIMPDVHAGVGCTIGTTMTLADKVCPSLVGVDIGCGMLVVDIGKVQIDYEMLDGYAHGIPSGREVWEGRMERFDLTALSCYRSLKDSRRLERSLGTLGGGNHFIEVDEDDEGTKYLVIHSGSRNLGTQVAKYYQSLAVDLNIGKDKFFKERDELIRTYKQDGRKHLIQAALCEMKKEYNNRTPDMPADLCYLFGNYMQDYLHDVDICQRFAMRNREKMAEILIEKMNFSVCDKFHTIHNYIDIDKMILRKGAVSALKGERLLIPINMRDGALICEGKGNPEWNYSAPHGAGRLMSRAVANEKLTVEEYKAQMCGIYTTCVGPATLDESPMAYKSIDSIVGQIEPTVNIVKRIKPVYNFKAAE